MTPQMDTIRWSILNSDWLCSLQTKMKLYIINKNKHWSWLCLRSWVPYWNAAAAKLLQSCLTVQPQRWQPTRLPHSWDSPGKNTGVGCHFLLQCMKVKSESDVQLSHVQLLATPWTAAYQAPPSMGFSRQEYWSGLPLPSPPYWNIQA